MFEANARKIVAPHVVEAVALAATVTAGIGVTTTLLADVPCALAARVDIFMQANGVGWSAVTLRMKALGTTIAVDTALGPVASSGTLGVSFTGAIGQVFDLIVTNAAAGAGTADCWAIARS